MLSIHLAEDTSEYLYKTSCPHCGSSDANAVYSDGHHYCFSCTTYTHGQDAERGARPMMPQLIPFGETQSLPKRGLTEETCRKYKYSLGEYNGQPVQIATYCDIAGNPVAQKLRFKNKDFKFIGDTKAAGLYGQHLWKEGGKMLVITEGEIDCLSISQAQGNRFPCVSVATGAAGAKKAVANNLEFVESFERVIIMFDNDQTGIDAAKDVASILSVGKAAICTLPLKDANEMLVSGKQAQLIDAMWQAKTYRPDGIIAGIDLWEVVSTDDNTETVLYPFHGLNQKTLGMRRGELVTITAGSGVGKTQICREIAYHLLRENQTIGYIALEESTKRTALGLMGLDINVPLHIDKEGIDENALKSAFTNTVGSGRVYLYDHFGSLATDNLLNKVRYLAKGCGVGFVILDHLSIVVSGVDDGDERKAIDVIMTKLRSLCEETGIGIILVSHLKKPSGDKGWEDGLQISLNSLRGSAGIAQLSDICIGVERNQQGDNPDVSLIRVLKNRFSGDTGIATYVHYNKETGRMTEVQDPTVFQDETEEVTEDF